MMHRLEAVWNSITAGARNLWRRFRALNGWQKAAVVFGIVVILMGAISFMNAGSGAVAIDNSVPTVSLSPVASLSGGSNGVAIVGTVRSESEADVLAEAGGVVNAVHASLGASVPAGFAIAELENDSQQAAVLQAEGAYDAALAARGALSLPESVQSASDAYASAYTSLDTIISVDIDAFFGSPTPYGPSLTLSANSQADPTMLSRRRAALDTMMSAWRGGLATAEAKDPIALLDQASANVTTVSQFLVDLAAAANERDSNATTDQVAALAAARSGVDSLLSTLSAARASYRTGSTQATAGADASVKQALGAYRAAQANLEKTIIRAPIAGTVNFLSIHPGDYVSALTHVATVAQNGALEIILNVSAENRDLLSVGSKVAIAGGGSGAITSISPALNPETKQIEVHVAVTGTANLENGESVEVTLPNVAPATASSTGPLLLPLTALKLTPSSRVVFSVEDGRLVSHEVEIGDVHGDRIEVRTQLPADLSIVIDARGLSEGQKVNVATSTP